MPNPFLAITQDLSQEFSPEMRYQRFLKSALEIVPCDAIALLQLTPTGARPVAMIGVVADALGRTFRLESEPRLAAILSEDHLVRFAPDDERPDPFDGLLEDADSYAHVHSCMGLALRVGDEPLGLLTFDAKNEGAFSDLPDDVVEMLGALGAAVLKTAATGEVLNRMAQQRGALSRTIIREALGRSDELVGRSLVMQRLRTELVVAGRSDLSVLVVGETGVGKELVTRRLHAESPRSMEPLVQVNCAALPEAIAESEFFGHRRGAFTGATEDRCGKFELAHRGTLMLDEIGELPLTLQAKLLRALQEGEIQRIGSDEPIQVDVRVIAATNRDLQAAVKAGRFRADLYHRLAVYPIEVPPLRQRRADILPLAGFFLENEQRRLGLGTARFSSAVRDILQSYDWPGNVRELKHMVMRGVVRAAASQPKGDLELLPHHLGMCGVPEASGEALLRADVEAELPPLVEATAEFQRKLIKRAVDGSKGNWAKAAKRLEIDRSNLHRLSRRLGIR